MGEVNVGQSKSWRGRGFGVLAAVALLLGVSGRAEAQTSGPLIHVTREGVTHSSPRGGLRPVTFLNFADCEADDVMTFPLMMANYLGYTLQVWAGTNCSDVGIRTSPSQAQCWLLYSAVPGTATTFDVNVHVRSMIAGYTGRFSASAPPIDNRGLVQAGPEACVQPNPQNVVGATSLDLYFMLIDPSSDVAVATDSWFGNFKLVGPPPPDAVSAGVDDGSLTVFFSYSAIFPDVTTNGYRFYCDALPGDSASACGTVASPLVSAGQPAPDALGCGSAGKAASSGKTTALSNGQPYSVAVAAFDTYGNTGPLSTVACQSPEAGPVPAASPTSDERVAACSFSPRRAPRPIAGSSLLGFYWLLRRKRSRR